MAFSGDPSPAAQDDTKSIAPFNSPHTSPFTFCPGICSRKNLPIIASRQMSKKYSADSGFLDWFGEDFEKLNITATYNLVYNAAIMVKAGIGYAVTLDKLINTSKSDGIIFRPLSPKLESGLDIVWKKNQVFSPAGKIFLERLQTKSG